jgi:hypothetical protein
MLSSIVTERYFDDLRRWLSARQDESPEWRDAAPFGDTFLYLTAAELADLDQQTRALTDRYLDRLSHPELRPPGARLVTYLHLAFPMMSIMGRPVPVPAAPPASAASAVPPAPLASPAPTAPTAEPGGGE